MTILTNAGKLQSPFLTVLAAIREKILMSGVQNQPREVEKPKGYRDLIVWQKSVSLAKSSYRLTERFPAAEKFGLVSQIRRAAVSVPSNIAEGQARNTTGEFIQFLSHAEGSVAALDTQLYLAVELGFPQTPDVAPCLSLVDEIRRMLNALRRSLSAAR